MIEEFGIGITRFFPDKETEAPWNRIDLDTIDFFSFNEEVETDQSRAIKKIEDEFGGSLDLV